MYLSRLSQNKMPRSSVWKI